MDLNIIQVQSGNVQKSLNNLNKPAEDQAIRKSAESFEAMFIAQLLNSMPTGADPDGPFGGGQTEEIFRGMMNEEYGKHITRNGGIGVADTLYKEILKMQEV